MALSVQQQHRARDILIHLNRLDPIVITPRIVTVLLTREQLYKLFFSDTSRRTTKIFRQECPLEVTVVRKPGTPDEVTEVVDLRQQLHPWRLQL